MIKNKYIKKIIITLSAVIALVVIVVGIGLLYIHSMYSKLNYKQDDNSYSINSSISDDSNNGNMGSSIDDSERLNLEKEILQNLKDNSVSLSYDENVYNILLVGVDSRENNIQCRSDSMILVSINKKTHKITLTSFLRDIYLSIPQCGFNRLNAANAFGGPQLLLDTIEQNFKIKVDRYAVVNFYSFMELIDMVGGVNVNLSEAERLVANNYIKELNGLLGKDESDGLLTQTGDLLLNGKQALGYARNRYTGTDFDRTDRQREILDNLFGKLKNKNLIEINNLLNEMLPEVITNVPEGEVYSLVLELPGIKDYKIEQQRIPSDNQFKYVSINGMSVISVDMDACIKQLRYSIYNE